MTSTNTYGVFRTNYVKIKASKWQDLITKLNKSGHEIWSDPRKLTVGVGDFTTTEYDDNLFDYIIQAMESDQTLVINYIGHEKLRYTYGTSVAFNSTGKEVARIELEDIYEYLPANTTRAEY